MTTSKALVASAPKRVTLTEKYTKLAETLELVNNDRERLSEALSNAVQMLRQEDVGWALPGDNAKFNGLNLVALQKWSNQIRASLTGTELNAPNPHMRNGFMLRHSFIWFGGIHYDGVPGSDKNQPKQGKQNTQKIIDDVNNQRKVFGTTARKNREYALFADGIYLIAGDKTTKKLRPVPLHEITDTMRDPLYEDEIVAYRWTRNEAIIGPNGFPTATRLPKSYWVYVDWYDGKLPTAVNYPGSGKPEPVLRSNVMFDLHANRPDGAPFGSPDAIAALVWARIIRDLIMNGVKMQDALAMFAFKATAPTKAGASAAALELAKPTSAGSAATMGGDNDFTALNSAGKGYDFGSIGFIVSTMAASLHVSGIALSANTALAGSSYGAAQTLDLPGRMAMETRRAEHIEFDQRIMRWLGESDVNIYFDTFEDASDEYRAMQALMLAWSSGTVTPEAFAAEWEIIYGRPFIGSLPKGVINPNTETKADKDAAAALKVPLVARGDVGQITAKAPPKRAPKVAKTAAAPDQGKNSAAGQANHVGDLKK